MSGGKRKKLYFCSGKLPEWSNGADSKSVEPFGVPGVRIPHFPQKTESQSESAVYVRRVLILSLKSGQKCCLQPIFFNKIAVHIQVFCIFTLDFV